MKTVAITGAVGSGKSNLVGILAERGGVVIDADRLGHGILAQPSIRAEIVAALGPGILSEGQVDRQKLGQLVFSDAEAMRHLNNISHPALARQIDQTFEVLASEGEHHLAVLEAAVYFLLPIQWSVDLVVTVDAPRVLRQARLEKRNGFSPDLAAQRIQAQVPLEAQWSQADLVVVNDQGLDKLRGAATEIMNKLGLDNAGD